MFAKQLVRSWTPAVQQAQRRGVSSTVAGKIEKFLQVLSNG